MPAGRLELPRARARRTDESPDDRKQRIQQRRRRGDHAGREPIPPPAGASRAAAFLALEAVAGALRPVPDIMEFDPDYGRPAEAQVRWERAHGRRLPDSPGDRG